MAKMAGSNASWATIAALAVAGACVVDKGGQGGGAADSVVAADFLAAVGPEVVVPALETFADSTVELEIALADWQAALSNGDGEAERAAAQDAWMDAMVAWERLEVMQIGPMGTTVATEGSVVTPGGEGLRDEVYSWPTINTCRIDQETAIESWVAADFFTENLVTAYGLDALEHLLHADLDTVCPGQVPPLSDGSWAALGDDGVRANRADYALAVAGEMARMTEELIDLWSPEGGDFAGTLGAAADPYEDEQAALDAVFHAMFYLETVTKDRKLARPLGLRDCGEATCPEDVELLLSGMGVDAVRGNLEGFQVLFTGGDGVGLDDVLADLGHADLAEQISADVEAALAAADALDGPLDVLIDTDPDAVMDLHDAVKVVTDALKGDLATVLVLSIPEEASGDND